MECVIKSLRHVLEMKWAMPDCTVCGVWRKTYKDYQHHDKLHHHQTHDVQRQYVCQTHYEELLHWTHFDFFQWPDMDGWCRTLVSCRVFANIHRAKMFTILLNLCKCHGQQNSTPHVYLDATTTVITIWVYFY